MIVVPHTAPFYLATLSAAKSRCAHADIKRSLPTLRKFLVAYKDITKLIITTTSTYSDEKIESLLLYAVNYIYLIDLLNSGSTGRISRRRRTSTRHASNIRHATSSTSAHGLKNRHGNGFKTLLLLFELFLFRG